MQSITLGSPFAKCIMFVLKEEYPELNMSKLEAGVQKYTAESDQGDKGQRDQDQVEAPLGGALEEGAGDHALEAGQGSTHAPSEVAGPPLSKIADHSPTEAADPSNP